MPGIEMSLEEMHNYMGATPCPEDFNCFWDEQLNKTAGEMIDFSVSEAEIPHTGSTKYYDIWFRGTNGGKMYAKYVKPESHEKVPVILQFHGYPGASRGWFEQTSFAGIGTAVLAMDCSGQGGYSQDLRARCGSTASDHIIMGIDGPEEDMYYVQTFLDTCLMVRIAQQLPGIDPDRIYVNGGSQGAGLGLVCAALNPGKVKKCATLYPFLSDYKRAYDLDYDTVVYTGLRYYNRWFNPDGSRTEEVFRKLGYIDVQNFVERITCPVLFGTGLMDTYCPPSSQFAVYHKIRAPKKHVIFPDYGHEEIGAFDDMLIDFFGKEVSVCLE